MHGTSLLLPACVSQCWEIQAAAWYSFSVKCLELVIGFKYECTETDPAPEYADPCLFIPLPSVSCCLHMKYISLGLFNQLCNFIILYY